MHSRNVHALKLTKLFGSVTVTVLLRPYRVVIVWMSVELLWRVQSLSTRPYRRAARRMSQPAAGRRIGWEAFSLLLTFRDIINTVPLSELSSMWHMFSQAGSHQCFIFKFWWKQLKLGDLDLKFWHVGRQVMHSFNKCWSLFFRGELESLQEFHSSYTITKQQI